MSDARGTARRLSDRARSAGRAALFRSLWAAGYELRRNDAGGWAPDNLAKPGLAPATLVDVGVGTGTTGLHEAFPDARHVFVEPLPQFEPDLKRLVGRFGGEYHLVAAGAEDGSATIHVDRRLPMQSSFSARTDGEVRPLQDLEVRVVRLDSMMEDHGWSGPFGLKLDTEGHELEVAQGASKLIGQSQFVIAELSLVEQFAGEAGFATFVAVMADHGLRLCDILAAPRSRQSGIIQVDAMFRRDDHKT